MIRKFTTSDGLSLAFRDDGEGPPVLCLAGVTRNSLDFDYVRPHLRGLRLIRPDARGRGASDYDPEFARYNIARETADIVELLDHLGLEEVAIIGSSRGGLIAMELALTAKHRLTGVFLNDIGPVQAAAGRDRIIGNLGQRPAWRTLSEAAAALPGVFTGFDNIPGERWRQVAERHWIEEDDGLHLRYDPRLRDAVEMHSTGGKLNRWPGFDALAGLPLGLLRGANSNLLSRETVAEMRRRRPDMIYEEVADRGHMPFLDEPESLSALSKFLKATA